MAVTPGEVLAELQRGNVRFWMNRALRPESSALKRRALTGKHFPSVAILGCSDSRVPVEIVFDQGLGDVFVVRVAGNILNTSTMASLQYAVHHLEVKVLIVLGHELCGAVKAARFPLQTLRGESPELEQLLININVGLGEDALRDIQDARAQDREAVITHVMQQVERLMQDRGINSRVESGDLIVAGAFYDMSSGIVDFLSATGDPCAELSAGSEVGSVGPGIDAEPRQHPLRSVARRPPGFGGAADAGRPAETCRGPPSPSCRREGGVAARAAAAAAAAAAAWAPPQRAVSDISLARRLREKKVSDVPPIPERRSSMPQRARTLLESRPLRGD